MAIDELALNLNPLQTGGRANAATRKATLRFSDGYSVCDRCNGVLHDIARWIWEGQPVPLNVPVFNCIWQRDANEAALRALTRCARPPTILNVAGPETISVRSVAQRFAAAGARLVDDLARAGR